MLRFGAWFIGAGGRLVFETQALTLLLSFSNVQDSGISSRNVGLFRGP